MLMGSVLSCIQTCAHPVLFNPASSEHGTAQPKLVSSFSNFVTNKHLEQKHLVGGIGKGENI
jgi:hypothetical protein